MAFRGLPRDRRAARRPAAHRATRRGATCRPWSDVPADEADLRAELLLQRRPRLVTKLRYSEGSMTAPTPSTSSTCDRRADLLKRDEVAAATTRASLRRASGSGRRLATARGFRSRSSIARAFARTARAPLYQYGYGAYGSTLDPAFDSTRGVAPRPRLRLRHRPRARRAGARPRLVRRRPAAPQDEHVHRLHRRDRLSGAREVRRARTRCSPPA